ncbi:type II toxin-antitoxin system PemK/MazF family toxin [Kitasatospora sp. NPDC051170]|uniref:type II toxin-antitoxin system PemK/MazF family toxin n=1 Tax=Kitasatospora sp. NPDC051170 TaxID=3364056 RepID=UPI0037AB2954
MSGMSGLSGVPLVLAVAGVAVVAAVAAALVRRARTTVAPETTAPSRGPRTTGPRPQEIWWAQVPFEDGPGAKDRPCLVLRVNGRTATVAKITSKQHARPGVLALPPGSTGDRQGRTSWLETDELREVPLRDFRRRAGTVDGQLWARVQREVQG